MNKFEMIKWLQNLKKDIGQYYQDLWHYEEMLDEVISAIENSEDCISREWVLEEFQKGKEKISKSEYFDELIWLVKHAPSAVPTEKTGMWVRVSGYATPGGDPVWECSKCGKGRHVYGIETSSYQRDVSNQQWVACPNCGVRMGK